MLIIFLIIILGCIDKVLMNYFSWFNIVLIVVDDLGFIDLGCFGSEICMFNFDKLVFRGLRSIFFYIVVICLLIRGMLLSGVDSYWNGYGIMEGDWVEN